MLFFSLFKTLVGKEVRTTAAYVAALQPALADGRAQPCPHREREGLGLCCGSLLTQLPAYLPTSHTHHPPWRGIRGTPGTQYLFQMQKPLPHSLMGVQCTLTRCGAQVCTPTVEHPRVRTPCTLTHTSTRLK